MDLPEHTCGEGPCRACDMEEASNTEGDGYYLGSYGD